MKMILALTLLLTACDYQNPEYIKRNRERAETCIKSCAEVNKTEWKIDFWSDCVCKVK